MWRDVHAEVAELFTETAPSRLVVVRDAFRVLRRPVDGLTTCELCPFPFPARPGKRFCSAACRVFASGQRRRQRARRVIQ